VTSIDRSTGRDYLSVVGAPTDTPRFYGGPDSHGAERSSVATNRTNSSASRSGWGDRAPLG
jgi:hypothetical protein